ncbi:cupredoxin domain-containing protein [Halovulum sp. GXIMD14794]
MRTLILGAAAALALAAPVFAEGDPTTRATRLDPLELDAASGFSITEYEIESGVYYRWRIVSDGLEEYKLLAPGLFRESWIDQVVIEDKEVKPFGLHAVEFDDEGEIDVWFIPIRPGTYEFFVEGLASQGFSGTFVVR